MAQLNDKIKIGTLELLIQEQKGIFRCLLEDKLIGVVIKQKEPYNAMLPELFESYVGDKPRNLKPATQINKYPTLKRAILSVAVAHCSKKQYTFIANTNITIEDGQPKINKKESISWLEKRELKKETYLLKQQQSEQKKQKPPKKKIKRRKQSKSGKSLTNSQPSEK